MSKSTSVTTTSKQISTQNPQTSTNTSSKRHATRTTLNKLFHSAFSCESVAYALPTLSLINEAKNSSSTWSNVVIAAIPYKKMQIAYDPSHVTQHYSHKNRKPQKQTEHPSSYPALPKISSIVKKHINILQSSANCKQVFPHPPVIAYKRNASLRDLLVHSELPQNKPSNQQPAGIHKCNHPRSLTYPFLQEGQTNYIFFNINESRKITDYISCNSKNLIYLIQCKKCHSQYIGETKRKLNERFGEHRRSILNHHQLLNPTPVSLHFNQPGHSINDVQLIPLELIRSKRDSVRKAREAHLINKAKTLHPLGINRRDETRQ